MKAFMETHRKLGIVKPYNLNIENVRRIKTLREVRAIS